eukprot:scaffold2286_cov240-Pinguiococcus_pyrenoidosus.AAC.8
MAVAAQARTPLQGSRRLVQEVPPALPVRAWALLESAATAFPARLPVCPSSPARIPPASPPSAW